MEQSETRKASDENTIFVGSKPIMSYVMACLTSLGTGSGRITLKARGRAISAAVDTAEIVRNRFMTDLKVESVEIGTENVKSERGQRNVSTMSIVLSKQG